VLELGVEEALRRSQTRKRPAEQHESTALLTLVGDRYHQVLGELKTGGQPKAVERVDTAGPSIDETVEEIARRLPVRLPSAPARR
jgi:hypothetical protein